MTEINLPGDEDHEIVLLCKKGDLNAFESLVIKYQKKMFNIAYRMAGNYEDACEIVQDAFLSAYRNIKNFEGKARFSTWLYTIVINLSKNRMKQMQTQLSREHVSFDDPIPTKDGEVNADPVSDNPSALEELEKKEIQQKVNDCIKTLDSEFREVLVLRDIQGFSYKEISDMLKTAEGTVKSRLFRARDAMKNCLKKVLGDL
jgi:RNA polymerase sigma-70 factor, ECF subfamily